MYIVHAVLRRLLLAEIRNMRTPWRQREFYTLYAIMRHVNTFWP